MSEKFQEIALFFKKNRITLGVAESCTGGAFSSFITSFPGASDFFLGGVIAYSSQVKIDLLEVPSQLIQDQGVVSIPVALKMAYGAKEKLKCHWSVAITGIAGPGGGTLRTPVGCVCFGIVGPETEYGEMKHFHGLRNEIQHSSVQAAAELLLQIVNQIKN